MFRLLKGYFLHFVLTHPSVHSMNAAFGSPSFAWLVKYQRQTGERPEPTVPQPPQNPFAEDTFDPMKHMNLDSTGAHVMATGKLVSG